MTRSQLKQVLTLILRSMTKGQRASLLRRKSNIHYPLRAEKAMASTLTKLYTSYTEKVMTFLLVKKPSYAIYEEALRKDSFESEFNEYLNDLLRSLREEQVVGLLMGVSVGTYVSRIFEFVKTFDEKEVEAYFLRMFKIGLPYSDTWWAGLKQQLTEEFLTRVTGTLETYLTKVQDIVMEGIRNEIPFDTIVEQIKTTNASLTTARARFLARDLIGKTNGLFTKNLHSALGMSYYLWSTAYDERVRGRPGGVFADASVDHWAMDNKLGSWSDSTIYSFDFGKTFVSKTGNMIRYHPGMDWACRCIASPWLQDMIIEIDREIRGGDDGTY